MRISLAGSKSTGTAGKPAGVTLLELILVITILSLVAALVTPGIGHWIDDWRLRGAAERIAQTIRYARMSALYEQRYYLVELHPEDNRVRMLESSTGFLREYALPSTIRWGEEKAPSSASVFRLLLPPSGAVEERTLWLRNVSGTTIRIHLNFLLGSAEVEISKERS